MKQPEEQVFFIDAFSRPCPNCGRAYSRREQAHACPPKETPQMLALALVVWVLLMFALWTFIAVAAAAQ